MTRKALCIGINNYPYEDTFDLRGCVNDAEAWSTLLTNRYDFARTDVTVLLDEKAKKKDIVKAFHALLSRAKKGDVLVFTNSSHGTYEVDKDKDELDGYDEAICPWDCETNVVLDDFLRTEISALKPGVKLYIVSDSCHSGSLTRARRDPKLKFRRSRFLNPAVRGAAVIDDAASRGIRKKRERYPEADMKELLLSGCNARQSSWDDKFGAVFHGALTYYAQQVIKQAKYKITWTDLHTQVSKLLVDNVFEQTPQLEGKADSKGGQIFT
ncbi:MAG: caspase family protein [Gemmatimonadaceae bacterium]